MNKNINQNLLSIVPLKSQFSRSTRIDQDSFEENIIEFQEPEKRNHSGR